MEHSAETSNGGATENGKDTSSSKLFDLQKLYITKPTWVSERKRGSQKSSGSSSALKKRKLDSEEGQKQVRKKSKKEVLLSSLSSGGRKSSNKGSLLSRLSTESGADQKVNGISGLGGISHNLNAIPNIPKRPRDLVGRKKVKVVDLRTKQDEASSSKASLDEAGGKLFVNLLGDGLLQNDNVDAKVGENGEYEGAQKSGVVTAKLKQKKISDDLRKRSSNGSGSQGSLKRADSRLSVHNGHVSTKKTKRTDKKTKQNSTKKAKETKPALEESSRIGDGSQDEEENLEENAARMLSSRFDTSCTGYSSSAGKSSKLPSTNGLSGLVPSTGDVLACQRNSREESDVVSSDAEVIVLRPRDQLKGRRPLRRRHFYEVFSREMDSYWALNRRIKVFWPLDQTWYVGRIIAYDPNKKLHHIKYDDRDEEWVDLRNERFKLLLLPSEVPVKVWNKKSRMHVDQARKEKRDQDTDKESNSNSYMESEPIISWLPRSRQKSSSFQTRKKQKTLDASAKSWSSSFADGTIDPQGNLQVGSSERNADDLVCSSSLPENPADSMRNRKPLTENANSHYGKPPIVYFRRRFHRREQQQCDIHGEELRALSNKAPQCGKGTEYVDSFDLVTDMLQSMVEYSHMFTRLSPEEFIWNIDDSGDLKLKAPVTNLKVILNLCFPVPMSIHNLFRGDCYVHLHRRGSLISVWPTVHLEMLFIDNIVGLRFLLYEGCLKKAIFLTFLVLDVFHQSNLKVLHVDEQLPVTSVRFKFTGLQLLQKQLVFAVYNFNELSNSKWSYLDRKLNRHCLLTKQVAPSECTYDNIKALRNGCYRLPLTRDLQEPRSLTNSRKRSRLERMSITSRQSTCARLRRQSSDIDQTLGKVPSFALSFAAAPTFFLSLHLKMLMKRSIPPSNFGEIDPISLMDLSDNIGLVGADSFAVEDHALSVGRDIEVLSRDVSKVDTCPNQPLGANVLDLASKPLLSSESDANIQLEIGKARPKDGYCRLSAKSLDAIDPLSPVDGSLECSSSRGMTVEIPSGDHIESDVDGRVQNTPRPIILPLDVSKCAIDSPGSRSLGSVNMTPTWPVSKQDILRNGFGHGPKKPRTQVSYSLPFGGHDSNSKNKLHHSRGFPHKRIRKASEKKTSEPLSMPLKNVELLCCDANVLITVAERGWRECGAKVVLELVDHHEWRLVVKISGNTKYSYKAHQFLQPGTTNRYTHVMMWKGGKDWILEFPDRSQWAMFKEMHEECYNRNFRAASVKNIPIPGVRLVEEADDNVPEVPFTRPCPKYYQQLETDVDIATDPGRVLYDMDSDDEQWITKNKASGTNVSDCDDISDEMFEKTMDVFEKVAYTKQRDHLSSDDLEDLSEFGPMEAIKIIHEHWREKRLKKGMPLIRHLQPPLWEKYQQQVKEWEQEMMKSNTASSAGFHQENLITFEKPSMFAFCLKPRGLKIPNRGSKQRSQKRLPIGSLGSAISGDHDAFHLVGRRLNGCAFGDERIMCTAYNQGTYDLSPVLQGSARVYSPRDAGSVGYLSLSSDGEKSHYPKLYRNKSDKLCFVSPPSNDQQTFASCSQRMMGKKFANQGWNGSSSELHSHTDPDGFQRRSFEQLDPSEVDEFRLRDAASAARHAVTIAKMKRENAQRMLCRADLAMHKAVTAIMTAEAIDASYKEADNDV